MRRIILLFFVQSFVCAFVSVAQTNYYPETKIFNESDYIYKAEVPSWGIINLYNTSNRWIGKDQMYKGTNEKYSMSDVGEDMFDLAS